MATANLDLRLRVKDDGSVVMTRTTRKLSDMGRTGQKVGQQLTAVFKRVGVALGAAFAVERLTSFTRQAIRTADQIGKVADKVGLTTSALQELRFAAERSGVATNTLDMAMQRFSRRVGEAAEGKGELLATLKQYDIEVKDALGRTRALDDVLGDLADVIGRTESAQERLRIAFKAFDSEGAALVNLLKDGSEGMQAMRKQARDLGLVLDDALIRSAEKANDSLDTLSEVLRMRFTAAAVELAPTLDQIATALTVWATTDLKDWLQGAVDGVNRLNEALEPLGTNLGEIVSALATAGISPLGGAILTAQQMFGDERYPVGSAPGAAAGSARKKRYIDIRRTPKDLLGHVSATRGSGPFMGAGSYGGYAPAGYRSPTERMDPEVMNAYARALGQPQAIGLSPGAQGARSAFDAYAQAATDSFRQVHDASRTVFDGMETMLVDFVATGKFQFKEFAEAVLRDLARIGIQRMITGPLASALGGFGGAGTMTPAQSFAGGYTPMADGGVVTRPTFALIGEEGPEAVVPLRNAGRSAGSAMGATYNMSVNIGGIGQGAGPEQVAQFRQVVRSEAPVIFQAMLRHDSSAIRQIRERLR